MGIHPSSRACPGVREKLMTDMEPTEEGLWVRHERDLLR